MVNYLCLAITLLFAVYGCLLILLVVCYVFSDLWLVIVLVDDCDIVVWGCFVRRFRCGFAGGLCLCVFVFLGVVVCVALLCYWIVVCVVFCLAVCNCVCFVGDWMVLWVVCILLDCWGFDVGLLLMFVN